jgi:N-acetylglucosamine malate deacetylase 1
MIGRAAGAHHCAVPGYQRGLRRKLRAGNREVVDSVVTFHQESTGPVDILALGPHPDDVEIGAAATLAKACAQGKRVVICDLTAGEMGTNGDPALRAAEAAEAGRRLGIERRICLHLPDTRLGLDPAHCDAVAAVIRALQPRLLLAPWGDGDRHPDHRESYVLTRRAIFLAGLNRFEPPDVPSLPGGGDGGDVGDSGPYRPSRIFYYLINSPARPDVLVDVSQHYPRKRAALAAFVSQFGPRPDGPHPTATPLNDGIYLPGVEGRDASFGRHAGVAFAEGFVAERYPCLDSLLDVISCR